MRIGIDGHVLTGKFQGTRTTLSSLLRALTARTKGHELVIYSEDPDQARVIVATNSFRYELLRQVRPVKRLLHVFPQLFRRDKVDLGVFQYIAPLVGRHIVFIHDVLPLTHPQFFPWKVRLRARVLFTLAVNRAAMVVVVSEFTRREVVRIFGIEHDRLWLVRNGPSFPACVFSRELEPASAPYILAVGRIEPRKNIALLVDAFLKADVPGVRLVVAGQHDLGYAYRVPDDPRIRLEKALSDDGLVQLYRGASLFVYPSAAEGFGLPLLDALLFGLPVISSHRTAMAEVGEGLATFFDPEAPDSVDVLAKLIAGHFGQSPLRAPTKYERQSLAAKFGWDAAAEEFMAAVDALAMR